MTASTLSSLRPRLPAGWKRAKSSWVNFCILIRTKASASPTAIIAVVLVLGAETERANFIQRPQDQGNIGGLRQRALLVAGDGDDGGCHLPERRQQFDDFLRFAAQRQGEDDIVLMDHAEIAVNGAGGVDEVGAGAGGVERAGDFLADVSRLAGAGDADASGAMVEQLDRLQKRLVEPIRDGQQRGRFAAHDLPSVIEAIIDGKNLQRHGSILALRFVSLYILAASSAIRRL